jgi:hypothetical protein
LAVAITADSDRWEPFQAHGLLLEYALRFHAKPKQLIQVQAA